MSTTLEPTNSALPGRSTNSVIRGGALAIKSFNWNQDDLEKVVQKDSAKEQKDFRKSIKTMTGLSAGIVGALGIAFKDGAKTGIERIVSTSNGITDIVASIFSIGFPLVLLGSEKASRSGKGGDTDDLFTRMIYTCASLGFASVTFSEPLSQITRSKTSAIATAMNLPHLLFSLVSYTGGRAMGFLSVLKKYFNKDPQQQYRLEQEFESWYTLGNIGSAQCSVISMAGQFALGWETITDVCKGDFASAGEKFKNEPISVLLGTVFNSWMWPFEWISKFADSSIRIAESSDNLRGAFGESSIIYKGLKSFKHWWHNNVKDRDSSVGSFLKNARELAKIESLLLPPIGMMSVVWPSMNKFLRGEFGNKEAQEIGGVVAGLDKICNIGSFFTHAYFTVVYGLSVRLPQFITTSIFYGSKVGNMLRGIDTDKVAENIKNGGSAPKNYIDPGKIRDKIFSKFDWLSKKAEKWLDKTERDIHDPDDLWLINDPVDKDGNPIDIRNSKNELIKGRKSSRFIRDFARVCAQENIFKPIREKLYAACVASEIEDTISSDKPFTKKIGEKPSDKLFSYILQNEQKENFKQECRERFVEFLRSTQGLNEEQIQEMIDEEYNSSGSYQNVSMNFSNTPKVEDWILSLLDNEIVKGSKEQNTSSKKHNPVKIKSETFIDLLKNPKDLIEVLKFKVFKAPNAILPLWIKGFVNVVDYGKNDEAWWKRNLKATLTGIQEGDIKQATDREFMPVVALAYQNAGKGFAMIHRLFSSLFGGVLPSSSNRSSFFST